MYEHELRNFFKQHKEHMMQLWRLKEIPSRMVMPMADSVIFDRKQLAKLHCKQKIVNNEQSATEGEDELHRITEENPQKLLFSTDRDH
jgi:hypothetical protein